MEMKKSYLVNLLDEIFYPIGFIRKGNNWTYIGSELIKIVNLQKSNFSNSYYINYGFIIPELILTTKMHVENRLAGFDKKEQERITELLNFESMINEDQRESELKSIVINKIKIKIQTIDSLNDLKSELKKRQHLNDIPIVVKSYLNLE